MADSQILAVTRLEEHHLLQKVGVGVNGDLDSLKVYFESLVQYTVSPHKGASV